MITLALVVLCLTFACEKKADEPNNNPVFLIDAHNLAHQTGGFYSKTNQVNITRQAEGDRKSLKLELSDPTIKPYAINIFLTETDWDDLEIESGQFEVLFLNNALVLHDPISDQQYSFVVNNDGLKRLEEKLPAGYLSKTRIKAIGIAVYGNHNPHRKSDDLVPGDCASSGGTGASQCSNSCCSITCDKGYYATCGNSCNCNKS